MTRRTLIRSLGLLAGSVGAYRFSRSFVVAPPRGRTSPQIVHTGYVRPVHFKPSPLPVQSSEKLLRHALLAMVPTDEALSALKIHGVVHQLRLWGTDYRGIGDSLSGDRMFRILLDDATYRSYFRLNDQSLLMRSDYGISTWTAGDLLAEPHIDKILSICGEGSVPLDTPVATADGAGTLQALLDDSIMRFDLSQAEVAWSLIAFASYCDSKSVMRNKFGKRFTIDDVASRVIAAPFSDGTCFGTHNLYSLAYLLHVDHVRPILLTSTRNAALEKLNKAARLLQGSQYATGLWATDWFKPVTYDRNGMHHPTIATKNLIRATGHHLEWLMITPDSVLKRVETLELAYNGLLRQLTRLRKEELLEGYNPITHALRAMCFAFGDRPETIARATV